LYIPHPHYKNYYSNQITREEAREKLNIPGKYFVFLFLGQIRSYKNLPLLIKAFKSLNDKNTFLLIAGKVYKDVSSSFLKQLIGESENIRFYDSFIKDDEVQVFLNAANLVVLPYAKVFNSGSVFLNLSFNKPTLAPDIYAFSELKEEVGKRWIKTYNGTLCPEILETSMKETINDKKPSLKPDIGVYDPKKIAENTLNFYKSLLEPGEENAV
jgi:glycosyltransferase involved in cell wall biosynthesis